MSDSIQCSTGEKQINIEELEVMLQEAKKGMAKVDKKYKDYKNPGHLFEYDIDFDKFLNNINHILVESKGRETGYTPTRLGQKVDGDSNTSG